MRQPAAQNEAMKHGLLCFLLVTGVMAAEDLSEQKEKIRSLAGKSQVEVRLDQPFADNDNPKQALDLYLPKQRKSDKPLPVVAFIHGGGWVRGDRIGAAGSCIQFARTGEYAAVAIGYRLTGEAPFPAQIHDCKAAIRWIRGHAKELNLDPEKIGVWGSSAGGHLSSLLGTSGGINELEGDLGSHDEQSSRVTCVANLCGPQDFSVALMFDKEGKPMVQDDAVKGLLGGTYEDKPDVAKAASPISYVSADDPPFVHFHGVGDRRVAYRHAELIHAALQKVRVPSTLIPITDGDHGSVSHPEVRTRVNQFMDRHLRGLDTAMSSEALVAEEDKRAP